MSRVNQEKIEDFNKWALLSFDHFENLRYADALTNMRKSGEVACKIILSFYKSKFDFSKKSLKELLSFIEKDNVIPKKIFNCLQTFQLYGNAASHDNEVSAKEAGYGIEALKIITNWIYVELLDEPIPFKIQSFLQVKDGSEKIKLKNTVKYLNEELINAKKATENLEIKLNTANATEAEKNKLNKELEEALSVIQKLETEITTNNIKEVAPKIPTIVSVNQDADLVPLETKINGKFLRKVLLISSLLFVVFFAIFYLFSTKKGEKSLVALNTLATDTSQLKVLVLPFRILQDNPNIDFKIETIITEKLSIRQDYGKSQINIIYNPKKDKTAISNKQANSINKLYNAEVILFGDVVENSVGDGYKLTLFYILNINENRDRYEGSLQLNEEVKNDNFNYTNLLNEIDCIIDLGEVTKKLKQNKLQDAIKMLQELNPKDIELKVIATTLEFNTYINLGNYDKAQEVANKLYKIDPKNLHVMMSYAYSLTIKNDNLVGAEKIYQSALKIYPDNTEAMLCYANTLSNFKKIDEATNLYNKIIVIDPNNSQAYYRLGLIASINANKMSIAKNYFIKSLEKDAEFFPSIKCLAQTLNNLGDFENSLVYANKYVTFVKNDYEIFTLISQIYQTKKFFNTDSVQKYLSLSKKYGFKDQVENTFSEGNLAYQKGDFIKAKELYLKGYAMDSSIRSTDPMLNLVDIYMLENNIAGAEKILLHYYQLDTTYVKITSMLCLVYCYEVNPNKDPKKSLYYGLKTLKLQPSNESVLLACADVYFSMKDMKNAEKYYTSAYNVNPNGYNQNYCLGIINKNNDNFLKAKTFFENAIRIAPSISDPYTELGFVYVWPPYQNFDLAIQNTTKAIELNPNSYSSYYVMAIIYKQQGNRQESEKFLNLAKQKTHLLDGMQYADIK